MAVSQSSRPFSPTAQTSKNDPQYLTVSEVTRLINDILELQFPQLLFRGEISQLTVAQSGHIYFTIKDDGAQLACAMWAGVARTLSFKPRVGMSVRVHGRPNVYAQSGRFQVVVHRIFEDGEGELRRRFLELQQRLEAEGFFASERKRSLPFLPKAVGIVTSSTGAVIHDMMVKIRERFPSMVVYLSDTRVQGEGAATEIARAIRRLDRSGLVDVLIVARGGGSLEDLWAFNEEEVVKAVFSCSRPVISGVGHEVDVTLCDLAADVRAPTPTAAAEMVVPHVQDLQLRVTELERRLRDTDWWYQPRVQRVDDLSLRLQARLTAVATEAALRVKAVESALGRIKPNRIVEFLRLKLSSFNGRLGEAVRRVHRDQQQCVTVMEQRLRRACAPDRLRQLGLILDSLAERLKTSHIRTIDERRMRLDGVRARLEAVNPQSVLQRGFSIVYSKGVHVRSVESVQERDPLDIRVADGVISVVVSNRKGE
jgi:exodeoxyribonuclease VII large subunit